MILYNFFVRKMYARNTRTYQQNSRDVVQNFIHHSFALCFICAPHRFLCVHLKCASSKQILIDPFFFYFSYIQMMCSGVIVSACSKSIHHLHRNIFRFYTFFFFVGMAYRMAMSCIMDMLWIKKNRNEKATTTRIIHSSYVIIFDFFSHLFYSCHIRL